MRRRPCWSSLLWALCFSFINTGDDAQNPVYPYMRERVSSVNYFFFLSCYKVVAVYVRMFY